MKTHLRICGAGLFFSAISFFSNNTYAIQINTADPDSAYHTRFCPPLQKALKKSQMDYKCNTTEGTLANIKLVGEDARQLGFAQLDLFALEKTMQGGKKLYHTLRDDISKVCLFLVTKDKSLENYGQIAANAAKLKFVLPSQKSSHVGTFQYLQQIDPHGLGRASNITYRDNVGQAVDTILESGESGQVAVFVQYPDPEHSLFKTIEKKGGHFVPVIDRNILRQDINGEKVYYAEDTRISSPKWIREGETIITSCTPVVLFTGISQLIEDATARKDHEDLVKTIEALPTAELEPHQDLLSQLWNKTRSLSAASVESLMKASEKAREAAGPMLEKAKEVGKDAMEASKPYVEKAKEAGEQALEASKPYVEKAKEVGAQALEASKPYVEQAREASKEALEVSRPYIEKAKEAGEKALEKADELADKAKDQAGKMLEKPEQ